MVALTKRKIDKFNRDVCKRLLAAKKEWGTLRELSERTGIHKSTLSKTLSGQTQTGLMTVDRICRAMGMTLSEALGGPKESSRWENIQGKVLKYMPDCSWRDAGASARMDGSGMYKVANGIRKPMLSTVIRLADAFGKEPYEMVID